MTKYDVDSSETQFQPGSNDMVMFNLLNIVDPKEMDDVEVILLTKLYEKVFEANFPEVINFSFKNISTWHSGWVTSMSGLEKSGMSTWVKVDSSSPPPFKSVRI